MLLVDVGQQQGRVYCQACVGVEDGCEGSCEGVGLLELPSAQVASDSPRVAIHNCHEVCHLGGLRDYALARQPCHFPVSVDIERSSRREQWVCGSERVLVLIGGVSDSFSGVKRVEATTLQRTQQPSQHNSPSQRGSRLAHPMALQEVVHQH